MIKKNDYVKEQICIIILALICFFIHIRGISKVFSPFLYGEEMGYWTDAATLAGYNWSPVISKSGIPWYTYGYSIILVPLFWIFDDMVSMYRGAIFLNAVFASLSFVICYSIAKKLGKQINKGWLLIFSFTVSLYAAFVHQSSIAIVETFLYLLIWIVFWLFLRYEEKPGTVRVSIPGFFGSSAFIRFRICSVF